MFFQSQIFTLFHECAPDSLGFFQGFRYCPPFYHDGEIFKFLHTEQCVQLGCQFSIWSLSPHQIQWHSLCDRFNFCKHRARFGSIGPCSFVMEASDLQPPNLINLLLKYVDDTDLVVPASHSHTVQVELDGISRWASDNNLTLNVSKSRKMIIKGPRIPPDFPSIPLQFLILHELVRWRFWAFPSRIA